MSDKLLYIRFDSNWADEIDVEGFSIMTEEEWNELKAKVKKSLKEGGIECYIGTNEEILYQSYEQWLDDFKLKEITAEEAEVITNVIGKEFGFFLVPEREEYE